MTGAEPEPSRSRAGAERSRAGAERSRAEAYQHRRNHSVTCKATIPHDTSETRRNRTEAGLGLGLRGGTGRDSRQRS